MKYAALLRGINVGGNNIVKMDALTEVFEATGFTQVKTYIQSGNVIFSCSEANNSKVTKWIESALEKRFHFHIKVMLRNHTQLKKILEDVPADWHTEEDVRRYIAFLTPGLQAEEVASQIDTAQGVDKIGFSDGVIYMSTSMEGLTKSKLNKLIGKKIYKEMTMRNYVTSKRLLELMDTED